MIGRGFEEAFNQLPIDEAIIDSKNMESGGFKSNNHSYETKKKRRRRLNL